MKRFLVLLLVLPMLLGATGDRRRVQSVKQALPGDGSEHFIIVLGDSVCGEFPFAEMGGHGMTAVATDLFSQDSDYWETTGAELGPKDTTTPSSEWFLSSGGVTWSDADDELTITSSAGEDQRGIWQPVLGGGSGGGMALVDGTARHQICFDIDMTGVPDLAMQNEGAAWSTNDATYLELEIDAGHSTCGNDNWVWGSKSSPTSEWKLTYGAQEEQWARHCTLVDPKNWGAAGQDYSADFGTGNDCMLRIDWWLRGDGSTPATIKVREISIKALTKSVRVMRYCRDGQTTCGVEEDDWPAAKSSFYTSKQNPVTGVVLVSGRNDYDANSGTCAAGAATIPQYFTALDDLYADVVTTEGLPLLKVMPQGWPHASSPVGVGMWGSGDENASIAWQSALAAERWKLIRDGWDFVDPSTWFQYEFQRVTLTSTLDPPPITNEGTETWILGAIAKDRIGSINYIALVSDTATSDSASNDYCFMPRNLTQGVDMRSSAKCTASGDISANTVFEIVLDQNKDANPGDVIALNVTEQGTSTDLSSAKINLVTYIDAQFGNMGTMGFDKQHPGQEYYFREALAVYKWATGKSAGGIE